MESILDVAAVYDRRYMKIYETDLTKEFQREDMKRMKDKKGK
jgi:hypothetical protein